MKLFDFATYEDYGKDYFLQILSFYPKFALFDIKFQWDDYEAIEWFPSILFAIGPNIFFGISIRWKRFYLNLSFIDFKPRILEYYQNRMNCND